METIQTRKRSLVPGAPSLLLLDDSRLYKIYNEYEICNMQRDGPAGWAGFESMFIDWKTPSPNPGLAIQFASRVGLGFFTFLRTRAAGAIHAIALRTRWSVSRRGSATGVGFLQTVPPTPGHPPVVSIKYSPKQLPPSPLCIAAGGGWEGNVKGNSAGRQQQRRQQEQWRRQRTTAEYFFLNHNRVRC
jgi:hypothetical protein